MENKYTIQQMANITQLTVHTLRYYERIGLIEPVQRNSSGYRVYAEKEIAWIEFINRLRLTGMPINKMKHYAELRNQGDTTVSERRVLLEEHQQEIERQISRLENNLSVIKEKIKYYEKMEVLK